MTHARIQTCNAGTNVVTEFVKTVMLLLRVCTSNPKIESLQLYTHSNLFYQS